MLSKYLSMAVVALASTSFALPQELADLVRRANITALAERQQDRSYGGQLDWGPDSCHPNNGASNAVLTFTSCSHCDPGTGGEEFPDCPTDMFIDNRPAYQEYQGPSWCNNAIEISEDFDGCSSVNSYSFSTPRGFAEYVGGSACDRKTGHVVGTMETSDGYQMTCVEVFDSSKGFETDCAGVGFSCQPYLQCVGVHTIDCGGS